MTNSEKCFTQAKWDAGTIKRIGLGAYVCEEKHLHILAEEILEENGFAATPENIEQLERAARDVYPDIISEP